jgi:rod shape-determining protein MreB
VHRPIRGGTINNFEVTQKMLRSFHRQRYDGFRRRSLCSRDTGFGDGRSNSVSIRDAARGRRWKRIDLVRRRLSGRSWRWLSTSTDERAHLVVDIGGGTHNIAIIASGRRRFVSQLAVGGKRDGQTAYSRTTVRLNYCLQIGEYTAEALKKELGALSDREIASANASSRSSANN